MRGITLDTGALAAADRNDRPLWALIGQWAARDVDDLDDRVARDVGRLLAASRTSDVIDAHVALGALRRGDAVVTSDPDDITALAESTGGRIALYRV